MDDSILRKAADIYASFDVRETRRLRDFVADVEALVSSSFFQPGNQTLKISGEAGQPVQSNLQYPGEEAVRAIVGLFRQLYNHREPTSYHQILKLLSEHAHQRNSAGRDLVIADLRKLRDCEKEALAPTIDLKWQHVRPDGSTYEEQLTPEVLIDLFLHGKYLHKGNEKSAKLADYPLAHLLQHTFFGALIALSEVYWVGRNVVSEVLKVPALLDAPDDAASG